MARILIFVEQRENRRLLQQYLEQYYQVAIAALHSREQASSLETEPFDLCILDGVVLARSWEKLQARKERERPVFLPVLLITSCSDVKLLTRNLWQSIDELINRPIEKSELRVRIEMLLRSRQYSLQLQGALTRERELNELKSRFISIASHEFRNPLSTIIGFSQILERGRNLSSQKQSECLQRIHNAANYTLTLLDDILVLMKSEARGFSFNPKAIAIEPFCRRLIGEIELSSEVPRTIDFVCEEDCDKANLDETLLRQILTNLLSNALKYSSPDSPVRLQVKCFGDSITFQVEDKGCGIPLENQKKLFEAFYRATNVGDIPGTGLGLAIAKQAVEQHGGTISFASEVDVGTTFTVTLNRC